MGLHFKNNKEALFSLGCYFLVKNLEWYDQKIEKGLLSLVRIDKLNSLFSNESRFLTSTREEFITRHMRSLFYLKISKMTPFFSDSNEENSFVSFSEVNDQLSKDEETIITLFGFLFLLENTYQPISSSIPDIKILLSSIDYIPNEKFVRTHTDSLINRFTSFDYNWSEHIRQKISSFEDNLSNIFKYVEKHINHIDISSIGARETEEMFKERQAINARKKEVILKNLKSICIALSNKSFMKKEEIALKLLLIGVDFVEIGFETNPTFIEDIKKYVESEESLSSVEKATFYSYFYKKDFLAIIEKERKAKNRDSMVSLIHLSSKAGLVDKKQARYIRSETSDKRARSMVINLMKNFEKVVDKQTVLAMLSDIRHPGAYISIIERVPSNYLFMFVGNPLRKHHSAKRIFENRMG